MGKTKIEWCDYTFQPWIGCTRVSPGCQHCYAESLAKRTGLAQWGPEAERRVTSDANWRLPLKWAKQARETGERPRVFCASMADVFEDRPELVEPRLRLWDLIDDTPELEWLLLTKRPENWRKVLPSFWIKRWPQNAMFGFTAEDQPRLDARFAHWDDLATTTLGLRTFVSCEPLLGPLDFHGDFALIDWVICGGESGHGARPMHPDWARSLRDQCQAAGVPFLFKQWGNFSPVSDGKTRYESVQSGVTMDEPFPMYRVGKKAAGRLLDGRTWDEFPCPPAP